MGNLPKNGPQKYFLIPQKKTEKAFFFWGINIFYEFLNFQEEI